MDVDGGGPSREAELDETQSKLIRFAVAPEVAAALDMAEDVDDSRAGAGEDAEGPCHGVFLGFYLSFSVRRLKLPGVLYGYEMVAVLLELGADIHAKGSGGLTPSHAMVTACYKRENGSMLPYLIKNEASVGAQDDKRLTAPHSACAEEYCPLSPLFTAQQGDGEVQY